MPDTFDGYHVWLGIPANEQPPNHYRLLGIALFELDLDVIDHAADRQMAHVRTFQTGPHRALSQQILNELAAARICLLSLDKKTTYDEKLRATMEAVPKASRVAMGQPLPKAQPTPGAMTAGAIPRATPLGAPVAPPKLPTARGTLVSPKAKPAHVDDDVIPLDVDERRAFESNTTPTIQLGSKRRASRRNDSWQRPAMMGIVGAVVVMSFFLLYALVQWLNRNDWRQYINPSILEPSAPATVPSDIRPETDDPPAPLPAASATESDTPEP
jgi:hypothetical protein